MGILTMATIGVPTETKITVLKCYVQICLHFKEILVFCLTCLMFCSSYFCKLVFKGVMYPEMPEFFFF